MSEARIVTEVEYTVDVAIEADEDARAVEQVRILLIENQSPLRFVKPNSRAYDAFLYYP